MNQKHGLKLQGDATKFYIIDISQQDHAPHANPAVHNVLRFKYPILNIIAFKSSRKRQSIIVGEPLVFKTDEKGNDAERVECPPAYCKKDCCRIYLTPNANMIAAGST